MCLLSNTKQGALNRIKIKELNANKSNFKELKLGGNKHKKQA